MKSKKIITVIIVLFLLVLIGLVTMYKITENNHYTTKIRESDISKAVRLDLNNFEIIDCYSKKNNVNSSSRFKFYNELLIVKLTAKNIDNVTTSFLDEFEICNADTELISNINTCFQDYNVSWIKEFEKPNVTWHRRVQQFEDENIKSSVFLYFLEVQDSNEYYIILDQINV